MFLRTEYRISPVDGNGYGPDTYTLNVAIVDPPPGPQAAPPAPDGDVAPWDEPDPVWPQGLDCVAWCKSPPIPDTVADVPAADVAPTDTAAQDIPTPQAPESGSSDGCSAGGVATPVAGIPLASALLLMALARFRRRNER